MLSSMTGYGRSDIREGDVEVTVEIRSLNNRFLDIVMKTPRSFINYESQLREMIGRIFIRGRVNIFLSISGSDESSQNLTLNIPLVMKYHKMAQELKDQLKIPGEITVDQILSLPEVIVAEEEDSVSTYWNVAERAIKDALEQVQAMRTMEGKALKREFEKRIGNLEKLVFKIESLAEHKPREELEKLQQRIASLVSKIDIDPGRLEIELAMIADRVDVTEECTRLHNHNQAFLLLMEAKEAAGRKLNFLLQEMNREANTIGNKAASSEISHIVVSIKDEVEKLREQVQNIE